MITDHPYDFVIQWHLTERCNLACSHCYQTASNSPELGREEIREALNEVDDMFAAWTASSGMRFAPSFNITGGEPFLREDLYDILEMLTARRYDSFLLTNGTLVDRGRARTLAELGVKGAQVSIEGCEEVHDGIRGEGSFARAADGIEHLLDAGLEVTLNVTLSRLNASSIKKVVRFASHIGAQRVGFSRLVPAGKGSGLAAQMLGPDEVKRLYESLFSLDIRNLEMVSGDPLAGQMRERAAPQPWKRRRNGGVPAGGCSAGVAGLTLLADGTIVPCRRLPVPLGNLRTDALREVWAASPVLEALRDRTRYAGRCGSCERWDTCRGCRAIAHAHAATGGRPDFLAEDPQCFLTA